MSIRITFAVFAVTWLFAAPVWAQQAEPAETTGDISVTELRLSDGSILYGTIQSDDPDRVRFKTIAGVEVDLKRSEIASMRPARGRVVAGEFRPADSNSTRMLFAPTARTLAKGEGYIGVYEFLLPFVQIGVTDRFSMGAGTPLIFFGDEGGRPVWVTPKYQFLRKDSTAVAAGLLHFTGLGSSTQMGIAYTVATSGSADNAFSAGAGWAYARYKTTTRSCTYDAKGRSSCADPVESITHKGGAVMMLGGERRAGRRVKIVTENYVFKSGAIVSVAVRFLGDRLSADLGVFSPIVRDDFDGFFLAPVVNFVWKFGS